MKKTILAALSLLAIARPEASSAQQIAYVTNQATNVVQMLRTSDWANVGSIPVGNSPTGISIPAVGGFAMVANKAGNSVSRIDLATGTVTATIPVPGNPTSVAVTADGTKAYVVQSSNCPAPPVPTPPPGPTPTPGAPPTPGPSPSPTPVPPCTVAVIDTASNTVTTTVTVGHDPFAVAVSSSGGFAYVTNRADDSLSVIDTSTDTVIRSLPVGDTPEGIVAGNGILYIANDASNVVSVYREIDFQPLATVPVGASPLGLAVSPDGLHTVVGNDLGASVSIIENSTDTVVNTKAVGTNPAGIAITPDSKWAVVANTTSGTVSIVPLIENPEEVTPTLTITLLGSPAGVAITPAPYFAVSKTASPAVVAAGGTVVYSISYANLGSGPGLGVTLTDAFPPELTFVSATAGGAPSGGGVLWNLGTVPVGATATVDATFDVEPAPPLVDGAEITNTATIADLLGNTASGSLTIGTQVPGGLGVVQANYIRKSTAGTRDSWRFKAQIPTLTGGFNNDQPITVILSTSSQLVQTFVIPSGAWTGRAGRNRWNFRAVGPLGPGVTVRGQLTLRGTGPAAEWHMNIDVSHTTLPIITQPDAITISVAFDADIYSSTRAFRVRQTSRPGTQRLSYRSVIINP